MKTHPFQSNRRAKKGQILVVYALLFPVLFLFLGLGIDAGMIYLDNAKLSRAIDATAIRMARKFESDPVRRQQIAISMMKINYPGFFESTPSWSVSGTLNGSRGETMTGTGVNGQTVTIVTKSDAVSGTVSVQMTGSVKHYTYFMPIAGDSYKSVTFSGGASAERYPACNVLILDNSGSMTGNGGSTNMPPAVKAFVEEFDENRDYLLVVGFNYTAWVLWPPPGENVTGGYVKPGHGFKTGSGGGQTFTQSAKTMADNLSFKNSTNAASAIRLAGIHLDKFYQSLSSIARSKIKFNFVFMTDGDFNGSPAYVRGFGFGYPDDRYKYDTSDNTFKKVAGTGIGTTFNLAQLPAWHFTKPVYGGGINPDTQAFEAGLEYKIKGSDHTFTWYNTNGTVKQSYNLRSVMNTLNLDTTACIQANLGQASPGQDNLYIPFALVQSSDIPGTSQSYNNTVKKFANYANGKKWAGAWALDPNNSQSSLYVPLSYYYPSFTHPDQLSYPSGYNADNTYNTDRTYNDSPGKNWWKDWYSYAAQSWQTGGIDNGTGVNNEPNWAALAQVSYLRQLDNATFYSVGFDQANEEIMRNMANVNSSGGVMDANAKLGKYYRVNNGTDLTSTFRDIARAIAVRLAE
jgi:Flp pilus assembly protein TadG